MEHRAEVCSLDKDEELVPEEAQDQGLVDKTKPLVARNGRI